MATTLLGVDDSKTMRRVIEITFAGEDFKTVLAENADDAMSKLNAERPSIMLVDAALEGTNGYELCQRVKAAAPSCAVVLLASKQQPYDRNRGSQVGADDFIDKPFDTQQLIDKVGALIRRLSTGASAPAPHPLAATAHGLGPAVPVAGAPLRTGTPDAVRARTATLAYGQGNPMMPGAGPVAAMVPQPVGAPTPVARPEPVPAPAPVPAPRAVPPVAPVAAAPSPQPVAAAAFAGGNGADFSQKLASIGLSADQVSAVLALSREVVEKVVWEVVPTLAETIIKEEIQRLTRDA